VAGIRGGRERERGDGRLARADVTLQQPQHRPRAPEVAPDRFEGGRLIGREPRLECAVDPGHSFAGRWRLRPRAPRHPFADLRRQDRLDRRDRRPPAVVRRLDRHACHAASLPVSRHHAHLEREELVERDPAERRIERVEVVGVVDRLERGGDPELCPRLLDADGRRQVLAVRAAARVEGRTNPAPQHCGRHALGQSIDGHDPAGVKDVPIGQPELRVLELGQPATQFDLARQHDLVAGLQAPLDVAAAEPDRLALPCLVAETGDGLLHAAAERRGDVERDDLDGRRDGCLGLLGTQRSQRRRSAEVVVPPGQVEEQVADRVEPEASQPLGGRRRHEPRARERRVDGDWRRGSPGRGGRASAAGHATPRR
jgi:hypothetical protein